MRKGNLIKMAAPAILSAAMMVSGLPVMAADFTSDTAVQQMTLLMLSQAMRKHLLLTIRQQQKMSSLQQQKQDTNMSMQV